MNVSDMVDEVADRADLTKIVARGAIDAVLETIESALCNGHEVRLGSIGKLTIKVEAPREVNSFGTKRKIGERKVVRFKAFAGMKSRINPPPITRVRRSLA